MEEHLRPQPGLSGGHELKESVSACRMLMTQEMGPVVRSGNDFCEPIVIFS